ncbi:arginine--tRNA ligase, partial [Patescibacteria group bacterium]|nr:arginine--tRNA ligase [Patescibacteria group bacterium]
EFKIQNSKFKIRIASPGFINFSLTESALQKEFFEIVKQKEKYGSGAKKKGKIQVEFISANPTGALTIGNGRGAFLGDALANVLTTVGFLVTREYYVNNAKASTQIKELGKTGLGKGTTYLTPELKRVIMQAKKKINAFKKKNSKNLEGEVGHLLAQEIQKENKKFTEKVLNIKFDRWFEEEELYKKGLVEKTRKQLSKNDLLYEKDGALWFRASKFGDSEDRVLVRSDNDPTYILPDLAYHWDKFAIRKFSSVIDIWGADHHGYVLRLKAGLKALGIAEEKLQVIITQLVRLVKDGVEVKMSKRAGTAILFFDLIREVGLDAARFFFLAHSPDAHMDFDMALAKERSLKNPVYYVQYAFVRCRSIIQKVKSQKSKVKIANQNSKVIKILNTTEEIALIKKLIQFPEVIEDTARDYQVHRLTRYAIELAGSFHNFYEKHRIITQDPAITEARLELVKATRIVLHSLLGLLGISAPKKM